MSAQTKNIDELLSVSAVLDAALAVAASAALHTNDNQVWGAYYLIEQAKTKLNAVTGTVPSV